MTSFTYSDAAEDLAHTLATMTPEYLASVTADRLGGSRRAILRRYLHLVASGACVMCGRVTRLPRDADERQGSERSDYAQMGHLVSRATIERETGEVRGGFVPGNLANWCKGCNDANSDNDVNPYQIRHPELIPLTWPPLSKRNPCA